MAAFDEGNTLWSSGIWGGRKNKNQTEDRGTTGLWTSLCKVKVVLWSKFCIYFTIQFWKVEVLNTYHAKFYFKIRTGSPIILTLFFAFGRPPFFNSKMAARKQKKWGLVGANRKWHHTRIPAKTNIASVANFVCNLREVRDIRKLSKCFTRLGIFENGSKALCGSRLQSSSGQRIGNFNA